MDKTTIVYMILAFSALFGTLTYFIGFANGYVKRKSDETNGRGRKGGNSKCSDNKSFTYRRNPYSRRNRNKKSGNAARRPSKW